MARVLLSGLVSDIRGKLNGSVFKQSNAGLVIQNKPASSQKAKHDALIIGAGVSNALRSATTATAVVRNAWKGMDLDGRNVWNALALAQPTPHKNNNALFLTGLQVFLKANVVRVMLGSNIITTPAIGLQLPAQVEVTSIDVSVAMRIGFSRNIAVDETFIIKVSAPIRDTVNTPSSRTRLMRVVVPVGTNNVDIQTEYVQQFGFTPAVGETVFASVVAQNDLDGSKFDVKPNRIVLS